jgi:hypothetical protein
VASRLFDTGAVRRWLGILHGDSPGRIHIASTAAWSGPSFPAEDIDAAVARVVELEASRPLGIYVRMTTLRAPLGAGLRGGVADSLALPALWADLDIAGPGHKDQNLPPDWAAVRQVVDASGLPPASLWIDSGHGAYPIWLLDVPHVLGDDLADVADLSANWQRAIAAGSAKLGCHYGTGVGDLARVLRIPGTVNRKCGDEKACRVVPRSVTGARYSVDELYDRCAQAMAAVEVAPSAGASGLPAGAAYSLTSRPGLAGLGEASPGDDFAARTSWADILEPHGWRRVRRRGEISDWCRPGKARGISATTNALGTDRLHVFTTSTSFETTSYSKFGALAVLEHNGDHSAAASALRARGYGTGAPPDSAALNAAVRDYLDGLTDEPPAALGPVEPSSKSTSTSIDSSSRTDRPPSIDPGDADARAALDEEMLRKLRYQQELAAEARRQRIHREARRLLDADEFASTWREPPSRRTLTDELAEPDDPIRYRVDRLLTVGGNALLTAAFKAGKTTLCNNLLRCLADGEPFLNRFDVHPPEGRIAVFNYEVSDSQYRRWLRRIGVRNTDKVCVLNLRGYRLPMIHALVEDWITKWLIEHEIGTWIVDPFARAMIGCGDENSNTDVGVMLDALDVIKGRAGVGELILPTHTGRAEQLAGAERARGATRLDDWADARWLLTADEAGRRFFRANGRDVDVDEELLTFDPQTSRLTLGGHDRRGMAAKDRSSELVEWIRENPGLGKDEIVAARGGQRTRIYNDLSAAVAARLLYTVTAPRGKLLHYVTGTTPPMGGESDA